MNCEPEKAYFYIAGAYMAEVEQRGRECQLDDFAKQRIWEMAQFMAQPSPKYCALICGDVGNGKTTLMKAAANAALACQRLGMIDPYEYGYEYKGDFGFRHATAKQLAMMAAEEPAEYELLVNCPLLALDEVGEEPTEVLKYGNPLLPVAELIENRYGKNLFTLITTNKGPNQLSEKYGKRVQDRLREMAIVINFGNHPSYRQ